MTDFLTYISFSENHPTSYLNPVTCGTGYCPSTLTMPYTANRSLDASSSYSSYCAQSGSFLSSGASTLTQQPPAPLPPPIASGRGPYAAVPYKQPVSQLPIDAPGAHEPTVSAFSSKHYL